VTVNKALQCIFGTVVEHDVISRHDRDMYTQTLMSPKSETLPGGNADDGEINTQYAIPKILDISKKNTLF
jgi:hypothetical protein